MCKHIRARRALRLAGSLRLARAQLSSFSLLTTKSLINKEVMGKNKELL
jgi:hypothetical protein